MNKKVIFAVVIAVIVGGVGFGLAHKDGAVKNEVAASGNQNDIGNKANTFEGFKAPPRKDPKTYKTPSF